MSDTSAPSSDQRHAALFAQLVMQQANMAMMLMGQTPHPETGQVVKDLEAAGFFIDVMEMLEVKTKGNLSEPEAKLLKQSLMSLRMAFVEATATPAPAPNQEKAPEPPSSAPPGQAPTPPEEKPQEEDRKKFTKKY
jgi:hypothetical protein